MAECVFCDRIERREYEATPWLEVVSFEPLDPVTPGHRLFVPHQHLANALVRPHVTGSVFAAAAEWAGRRNYECNLITSSGPNASQTVFHLHVHVVPRTMGDGLALPWTGQKRG